MTQQERDVIEAAKRIDDDVTNDRTMHIATGPHSDCSCAICDIRRKVRALPLDGPDYLSTADKQLENWKAIAQERLEVIEEHERNAVERERKAFANGAWWRFQQPTATPFQGLNWSDYEAEAALRYPMPEQRKETTGEAWWRLGGEREHVELQRKAFVDGCKHMAGRAVRYSEVQEECENESFSRFPMPDVWIDEAAEVSPEAWAKLKPKQPEVSGTVCTCHWDGNLGNTLWHNPFCPVHGKPDYEPRFHVSGGIGKSEADEHVLRDDGWPMNQEGNPDPVKAAMASPSFGLFCQDEEGILTEVRRQEVDALCARIQEHTMAEVRKMILSLRYGEKMVEITDRIASLEAARIQAPLLKRIEELETGIKLLEGKYDRLESLVLDCARSVAGILHDKDKRAKDGR